MLDKAILLKLFQRYFIFLTIRLDYTIMLNPVESQIFHFLVISKVLKNKWKTKYRKTLYKACLPIIFKFLIILAFFVILLHKTAFLANKS